MKALPGLCFAFFFQAEGGMRDLYVTGVQTCALPISHNFSEPTRGARKWSEKLCARNCGARMAGSPSALVDTGAILAILDRNDIWPVKMRFGNCLSLLLNIGSCAHRTVLSGGQKPHRNRESVEICTFRSYCSVCR